MLLAGLDIETTGLDMKAGHRLIQIGISVLDTETGQTNDYVSDVRPVGKIIYSDYALKVNGFSKRRIKAARSQDSVDAAIWSQMMKDSYKLDSLIPVGFNVIMFDMPFIKKELPLVSTLFTYPSEQRSTRAIDLMSLGLLYEFKTGTPYDSLKKDMKDYVEKVFGYENHHDALYDAKAALETLRFLRDKLGDHT
jgi:DNA polymerase III epsilon subunit-like protein